MSLNREHIVQHILADQNQCPRQTQARAFAPTNIALCKYWGKRDQQLNLPMNSSLSVTLPDYGAEVELSLVAEKHSIHINGYETDCNSSHYRQWCDYLNCFRGKNTLYFVLVIKLNIPLAAGFASSAAIYAAVVLAFKQMYQWQLAEWQLSILARLGSGSACRSFWPGFVKWNKGSDHNGMDSYAVPLHFTWPELCIGLVPISHTPKLLSSRQGMQQTVATSPLYKQWPSIAEQAMTDIEIAIKDNDFNFLGQMVEMNACAMHATMLAAWPPINYSVEKTLQTQKMVWQLRSQGVELYFTQDAGPNIKLLFLADDSDVVKNYFNDVIIVEPFR